MCYTKEAREKALTKEPLDSTPRTVFGFFSGVTIEYFYGSNAAKQAELGQAGYWPNLCSYTEFFVKMYENRKRYIMTKNRPGLGKVVGANLKRLIKESTYRTQVEFSYAFGVDERTVRRWVSGKIEKIYIIDEIADFFMIDRMDLLSEREEVPFL